MKRKFAILIVIVIMALCVLSSTALATTGDTGSDGTYSWKELNNGTYEITGYLGSETGTLTIPGTLHNSTTNKDMAVTGIGSGAFQSKSLSGIVIPEGVTYMGDSVFYGCANLVSVSLPSTLTSMGTTCFSACTALKSIALPEKLTSISNSAFYGDTKLETVTMGNKVTAINDSAFNGCSKLTGITLSNTLASIGNSAFQNSGLTSIEIPGSVQTIASQAFVGLPLTSVKLNEGLVTIGPVAFEYANITEITIPKTVTSIGDGAFALCSNLTNATILNKDTVFGNGAFGSDTCTIYGFKDSTAQGYASGNGFAFGYIYKVTFDSWGGPDVPWVYTVSGGAVARPEDPARTNYVFAGWYKDKSLTDAWDFDADGVTKNITLYAKWYYVYYDNGEPQYFAGNEYDQLKKFLSLPSNTSGETNGQVFRSDYNPADPWTFYNMTLDEHTEGTYDVYHIKDIYWNTYLSRGLDGDLDLSNFTYIEVFKIEEAQIESLELDNDTALTTLECTNTHVEDNNNVTLNTGITSLDLRTCTALKELDLSGNFIGGEFDLSKNTAIETLNCQYNQIEKLDLNSAALSDLRCSYNKLESLDTSSAGTSLTILYCDNNELTSVNIAGNTKLDEFDCSINKLSGTLSVKDLNIQRLYCRENELTGIDVSGCDELKVLLCGGNSISSIDTGDCTSLSTFGCDSNVLTALNLSANTALTSLNCDDNQISSLDVSANTELGLLYCNKNKISSLDVSANTSLEELDCSANLLTGLSLSSNTNLESLACSDNALGNLSLSANTLLDELECENDGLTTLDLSSNTNLTRLDCSGNTLGSLDISKITGLERLYCEGCGLSVLDLSKNADLRKLYCKSNNLTSLNTSGSSDLYILSCEDNQLTSLNTTGCIFGLLDCTGNQLAYIKSSIWGNETSGPYTIELKSGGNGYIGMCMDMIGEDEVLYAQATPKADTVFVNWTNAKGKLVSKSAKYDLSFDKAYSLKANFDNLAIPSNVSAAGTAYNKINISWDAVTGAAGYRVYRATSSAGKYSLIKSVASTSYTNTGVTTGKTYYYEVAAYDKTHTGQPSAPVSAATTLGQVTGANAVPYRPTSVNVSWNAVEGAAGYRIYTCDSEGVIIKQVGTSTSKSCIVTGLTPYQTYNFRVKAFRGSASGDYSELKSATPIVGQVTNVNTASASQTSVTITWNAVAGATKYEVYGCDQNGDSPEWLTTTASKSYTNNGLTFGQKVYYKVFAYAVVNKVTYNGDYSDIASATVGQVTNVKASSSNPTKAVISWSKISGATAYHVLRCDTADGTYAEINTDVTAASYTDTDLIPGKTYYYKVAAYFGTTPGELSVYASVTPIVAQVTGLKASRVNSSKLKITWKAVNGATGYKVYISTGAVFTLLSDSPAAYCYDLGAPKTAGGYYFKVVAYTVIGGITYESVESVVYHFTK